MADGFNTGISGWFCIACVVHEEWQSVRPARLDGGNATVR